MLDEIETVVAVYGKEDYWTYIFGFTEGTKVRAVLVIRQGPRSTGTCFSIGEDIVITAHHVVENSVSQSVQFEGEREQWAQPVGYSSKNDLAILRLRKPRESPGLTIEPSSGIELGDELFTVGFPRPSVQGWAPKYTEGTVSSTKGIKDSPLFFQMSVPIQPGNSGGPVLNAEGQVVGIVAHYIPSAQVANYAANTIHLQKMLKRLQFSAKTQRRHKTRKDAILSVKASVCKVRAYGKRAPQ